MTVFFKYKKSQIYIYIYMCVHLWNKYISSFPVIDYTCLKFNVKLKWRHRNFIYGERPTNTNNTNKLIQETSVKTRYSKWFQSVLIPLFGWTKIYSIGMAYSFNWWNSYSIKTLVELFPFQPFLQHLPKFPTQYLKTHLREHTQSSSSICRRRQHALRFLPRRFGLGAWNRRKPFLHHLL